MTHTPEQNGTAERRNRTLMDMTRCLLIQSGLPNSFWGEAVNTANHIRNRCPSRKLNGKTPHELWTGRTPNIKYFREFGCEAYTRDRNPNKSKFDPRSKKGIFVGYANGSKAYRIWIPEDRKIDIARDVKFVEKSTQLTKDKITILMDENQNETSELEVEVNVNRNRRDTDEERDVDEERDRDNESETDLNQEDEDTNANEQNESRRGPGRPRLLRTGLRGRPRKNYNTVSFAEEIEETAHLAEIPPEEALSGPDREDWIKAMAYEWKSIIDNNTWDIVDRPREQKVIKSRVVLRNKYTPDGNIERRKARVVAKGFSQRPGIEYNETFAPVVRMESIRAIIALAAQYGMIVNQCDVTTAYLNGTLKETVHMEIPEYTSEVLQRIISTEPDSSKIRAKAKDMLKEIKYKDKVCLLRKALYGLRQAGRSWHERLSHEMNRSGLIRSSSDPCIFFSGAGADITIVAVYVDDLIIASRSKANIEEVKRNLSKNFNLKDLGNIKHCLGMEFTHSKEGITLTQRGYANELLNRFGMAESRGTTTPIEANSRLLKSEDATISSRPDLPYRELVGGLMYLAVCTRPDLAHAASYLSQFNHCFDDTHWTAAKRTLRYLNATKSTGLLFQRTNKSLEGYTDADWANCTFDRRSYTGYAFILSGSPISWESRKQRTVAMSSTEAEYMALSEATKEGIRLRNLLLELGFGEIAKISIFCDSNGAIKLAENPIFHNRTKHIDVRHHFVREAIEQELIKVNHVSTEDMAADILTKGLPKAKHRRCMKLLGLYEDN